MKHIGTTGVCIFRPPDSRLIDCVEYFWFDQCVSANIFWALRPCKCNLFYFIFSGGGNSFIFKTGGDAKEPWRYHTLGFRQSARLCCVIIVYCWIKYTPWKNQGPDFASHVHTHTRRAWWWWCQFTFQVHRLCCYTIILALPWSGVHTVLRGLCRLAGSYSGNHSLWPTMACFDLQHQYLVQPLFVDSSLAASRFPIAATQVICCNYCLHQSRPLYQSLLWKCFFLYFFFLLFFSGYYKELCLPWSRKEWV